MEAENRGDGEDFPDRQADLKTEDCYQQDVKSEGMREIEKTHVPVEINDQDSRKKPKLNTLMRQTFRQIRLDKLKRAFLKLDWEKSTGNNVVSTSSTAQDPSNTNKHLEKQQLWCNRGDFNNMEDLLGYLPSLQPPNCEKIDFFSEQYQDNEMELEKSMEDSGEDELTGRKISDTSHLPNDLQNDKNQELSESEDSQKDDQQDRISLEQLNTENKNEEDSPSVEKTQSHKLQNSQKSQGKHDDHITDLTGKNDVPNLPQSVEHEWSRAEPSIPVLRPPVSPLACPFSWSPGVVVFNDYKLGRTYRKTLSLVNITSERCSCRYLGMFEQDYYHKLTPLAECLNVQYTPAGLLGTGMSCRVVVTFTPRALKEDSCWLRFESHLGEFQVEIRCVAQCSLPQLQQHHVSFGTLQLGSRVKRRVILKNLGSKPCRYRIRPIDASTPLRSSLPWSESGESGSDDEQESFTQNRPVECDKNKKVIDKVNSMDHRCIENENGSHTNIDADTITNYNEDGNLENFPTARLQTVDTRSETSPKEERREQDDCSEKCEKPSDGCFVIDQPILAPTRKQFPLNKANFKIMFAVLNDIILNIPIIDFDDGIGICGSGRGWLPSRGRIVLHFGCVASTEGPRTQRFLLEYDDSTLESATLECEFIGERIPLSVTRPHLTLGICLCGSIYWEILELVNSGTIARTIKIKIPKDLREFVEVRPSLCLVQAASKQEIKVFFRPSRRLLSHRCFDTSLQLVDVPLTFVSKNVMIANGSLQAAVTSLDLLVQPITLEMGVATVREAVKHSVKLTNPCLATQLVQFVDLPEGVSVQPDNGRVELLPGETTEVDVIFSPKTVGLHEKKIHVMSSIGARATIKLHCTVISPSMYLSSTNIKILGLPIGSEILDFFHIHSAKASSAKEKKLWSHGCSFDFQVPSDAPFQLDPVVGYVPYLERQRINILVKPRCDPYQVKVAAALHQYEETKAAEQRVREKNQNDKSKRRTPAKQAKHAKSVGDSCLNPLLLETKSEMYKNTEQRFITEHEPSVERYLVPCFVKNTALDHKPKCVETLYLEVVVVSCRPDVLLDPSPRIDFGPCATNTSQLRRICLLPTRQFYHCTTPPRCSVLDGPFYWKQQPSSENSELFLWLQYIPDREETSVRFITVAMGNTKYRVKISGDAVHPNITVHPGKASLGPVKPGSTAKHKITIQNQCRILLKLNLTVQKVDSDHSSSSEPPGTTSAESGHDPWSLHPSSLTVPPHHTGSFQVTFSPSTTSTCVAHVMFDLSGHRLSECVKVTGLVKEVKEEKPTKGHQTGAKAKRKAHKK